jgi:hypothetical protein
MLTARDGLPETNHRCLAQWQRINENNGEHRFNCTQGYHRLSRYPSLGHTHRPWCVPAVAIAIPGGTSLAFRRLVRVHGKRRLWGQIRCHMTNAGFVSPCVGLFGICVNTSDDRCSTLAFTRFGRRRLRRWCHISWCRRWPLRTVAISFQDFLGRDIGTGREQSGVVEDES